MKLLLADRGRSGGRGAVLDTGRPQRGGEDKGEAKKWRERDGRGWRRGEVKKRSICKPEKVHVARGGQLFEFVMNTVIQGVSQKYQYPQLMANTSFQNKNTYLQTIPKSTQAERHDTPTGS
jgi:hypothetical protein